jgi:hypothetical protein
MRFAQRPIRRAPTMIWPLPLPFEKQTTSGNPVIDWQLETLRITIDWLTIDIDLDDKGQVC